MPDQPEVLAVLDHMAEIIVKRVNLLKDIEHDKSETEKHLASIEQLNKQFVQRELKMVRLKEKIKQLKEAKG